MKRVALLALVAAACTDGELKTNEVVSQGGCGWCGNSPVMDTYLFHELSKLGAPNAQGLRIQQFLFGGTTNATLDVQGGRVIARVGATMYTGAALTNSLFVILNGAGQRYAMKIQAVSSATYFAALPGGSHPTLETYRLGWAFWANGQPPPPPALYQPVCPAYVTPAEEQLGIARYWSAIFEGDRLDGNAYTDYATDTNWFNIGCAGHIISKMAVTGHSYAAASVGFVTNRDQRQTAVKMFAADYCGTGKSFTVAGNPLTWADDNGWMQLHMPNDGTEALWGPTGASCLNTPRCDAASASPECAVAFPDGVEKAIHDTCTRPPPCSGGSAHLVSAILPPPP